VGNFQPELTGGAAGIRRESRTAGSCRLSAQKGRRRAAAFGGSTRAYDPKYAESIGRIEKALILLARTNDGSWPVEIILLINYCNNGTYIWYG
jgi:hypothetical protein